MAQLIKLGAHLTIKDNKGRTPGQLSAELHFKEAVELIRIKSSVSLLELFRQAAIRGGNYGAVCACKQKVVKVPDDTPDKKRVQDAISVLASARISRLRVQRNDLNDELVGDFGKHVMAFAFER